MRDYFATADARELMNQAVPTIATYLSASIRAIDAQLGDGYAALNPELLGAFLQAAASDFNAASLSKALGGLSNELEHIASSLSALGDQ